MRLRVGAKLTLGFGAVMGLASVIVVVALVRLASLDAVIDEITSKGLPRVELMHAIVDQAGNLTRDSQAILLATNSAARGQQMIQFNRSRAALGELLGKFDEVLAASGKDNDSIDDRLHAATSDYLVSAIRFTRIIDNKNLAPERDSCCQ
jgi:phosphoglycerate-specific signal transduction histidine kinase